MPIIERHLPGTFSWFELATLNQAAAKEFYSRLFGWSVVDFPMGPSEVYSMFKLDGLDVAGSYTLRPDMLAQNIPPHWDIYIAVDSADETAAQIESFGGKLLSEPFDVMTYGRMAVAADPTGAVFCIWQPISHLGARISSPDGTVCWADLVTAEPEAASEFYAGVFGWQFVKSPTDSTGYLHIKSGDANIGGIPPANGNPGVPPHWMLYFSASDIDITTNKAGSLGATTLLPVTEIPETGNISVLSDPQGAMFALYQSPKRH